MMLARGAMSSDELGAVRPDDPCTQRALVTWALRAATANGVADLPASGASDSGLAAAAVRLGMAVPEGDHALRPDEPATRGHCALVAAGLIAALEAAPSP